MVCLWHRNSGQLVCWWMNELRREFPKRFWHTPSGGNGRTVAHLAFTAGTPRRGQVLRSFAAHSRAAASTSVFLARQLASVPVRQAAGAGLTLQPVVDISGMRRRKTEPDHAPQTESQQGCTLCT